MNDEILFVEKILHDIWLLTDSWYTEICYKNYNNIITIYIAMHMSVCL